MDKVQQKSCSFLTILLCLLTTQCFTQKVISAFFSESCNKANLQYSNIPDEIQINHILDEEKTKSLLLTLRETILWFYSYITLRHISSSST